MKSAQQTARQRKIVSVGLLTGFIALIWVVGFVVYRWESATDVLTGHSLHLLLMFWGQFFVLLVSLLLAWWTGLEIGWPISAYLTGMLAANFFVPAMAISERGLRELLAENPDYHMATVMPEYFCCTTIQLVGFMLACAKIGLVAPDCDSIWHTSGPKLELSAHLP